MTSTPNKVFRNDTDTEEQSHLRHELLRFLGIDKVVFLKFGHSSIHACFEKGHSKEDRISGVQYVKFPFSQEEIKLFVGQEEEAVLLIDHPNYQVKAMIEAETRKPLAEDFMA